MPTEPGKGGRRYEPDRRGRIIDTALAVIAEHGIAGTSHRRIADAAGIPLGSMTYYFSGIDEVITAAFTTLSEQWVTRYDDALHAAKSVDEVCGAVAALICGQTPHGRRDMVLLLELYAYMSRRPDCRAVVAAWMTANHQVLARHVGEPTARALDAVVEGIMIHNFVQPGRLPYDEVLPLLRKIAELP
ncbi:TetR/AcrR family transcriptional regulator [Actinoplanes couchii]|uniref:TetR family transcriptional regulator n=1 Tax=Actinoplanes couchii TaxID=403638 RepID=A0ABQ3XTI0_9ACTN|nr:TetR family transcriptional regulator [Actinoplanes couchii]MDR6318920.1 DNA-binding transcriptional regulator YbjK [Actinoplanes couchii]GID61828.1 TetR family transcriptional regulator [Actinoplanes couchii]